MMGRIVSYLCYISYSMLYPFLDNKTIFANLTLPVFQDKLKIGNGSLVPLKLLSIITELVHSRYSHMGVDVVLSVLYFR